MDHLSGRRQRLWEAMESCRHGSDDLSDSQFADDPQFAELAARLVEDPELRVQFQRLQAADKAITAVFADVPVPVGLANRISQRLAGKVTAAVADSASPTPLREQAKRFSRRRLFAGFTALSAAVILLGLVWIETHPSRHDTPDKVLDEALDFFGRDNQFGGDNQPFGELVSRVAPPAGYPLSRDIRRDIVPDVRWRYVEKFLGGRAMAYDLPTGGGRATLYVLERNVPGLPAFPPDGPSLSTGGKSAAAWQAGNLLYVLVVEGDAGTYSGYLDQAHGPLT